MSIKTIGYLFTPPKQDRGYVGKTITVIQDEDQESAELDYYDDRDIDYLSIPRVREDRLWPCEDSPELLLQEGIWRGMPPG